MSIGSDKDWLRSIGVSTPGDRELAPVDLDDGADAAHAPSPVQAPPHPDETDDHDRTGGDAAGASPAPVTDHDEPGQAELASDEPVAEAKDEAGHDDADESGTPERRTWRFNPWVAAASIGAVTACALVTWGVTVLTSTHPSPPPRPQTPAHMPVQQAVPPTTANPASVDGPIPFTASADCPLGSTSANVLGNPQALAPWICVRPADGQLLNLDMGSDYVVTAVQIETGAVKPGPGDQGDPWRLHRVVTRLQWSFNDLQHTTKTQDTGNKRGPVVMAIPNVHASAITVTIQQTSRPPVTAPTPTPAAGSPGGGMLGSILGGPGTDAPPPSTTTDPDATDPSDGTFAITSIKLIGHRAG